MRSILVYIVITAFLFSCKKKDEPTPTPGNTTTGNPTNIYTYGSLGTTLTQYYDHNAYSGSDSIINAFFFTEPLNASNTVVDAGTVTYNGNTLQNSTNFYSINQVNIHQPNSIWTVSGIAPVPAINYTMTPNYPIFTGNAQLPDSFSISSGFTMTLNGVSNSTGGCYIQINDVSGHTAFKTLTSNQTSCTFSASDLSSLQPCFTNASIMLHFSNTVFGEFGGKKYGFTSSLQHIRTNLKIKS